MHDMNQFLSTVPFDLYELALFHLVVKHRSFTKAAEIAGLTQSAITRQMQGVENGLGIQLLERTTRNVRVTPAGEFQFGEAPRLLGDVDRSFITWPRNSLVRGKKSASMCREQSALPTCQDSSMQTCAACRKSAIGSRIRPVIKSSLRLNPTNRISASCVHPRDCRKL